MTDKKDKLTEKIIQEIENGAAARWYNPYKAPPIQNLETGWRYKGKNKLFLTCQTVRDNGYSPFFITYNQAQKWGGLRKGSKAAAFVVLCLSKQKDAVQMAIDATDFDDLDPEDIAEEIRAASFKRSVYAVQRSAKVVFSALDLVNPPADVVKWSNALKNQDFSILKDAIPDLFSILKKTGVPVKIGGGQAFYRPDIDSIFLPSPAAMRGGVGVYCSTALHELTHSYCKRVGNKSNNGYDVWGRRLEEMVAEFGALFLCNALRLPYNPTDRPSSLRYIKDWGGRQWRDLIPGAIQEAQKRADAILSIVDNDNNN